MFLAGKDITIALHEIRELQNKIDSLRRQETDNKNTIQDLEDEKNRLLG